MGAILVVDDEPGVRAFLSDALTDAGGSGSCATGCALNCAVCSPNERSSFGTQYASAWRPGPSCHSCGTFFSVSRASIWRAAL